MAKILLVEDDREISKQVKDWLELNHHSVESSENGKEALEFLQFYEYDVIILDWNLPEMEGIDILRQFRDGGGKTPVLMLTGKDTVDDIEQGLVKGADDYLTKPFDMRVLGARVNALLRRAVKTYEKVIKIKNLELDTDAHTVLKDGKEVKLQPQEFALLEFMLRHKEEVFSIEALLNRVWPSDSDASPDTVRVCITRLRNKIDTKGDPSIIRTMHRIGYRIDESLTEG